MENSSSNSTSLTVVLRRWIVRLFCKSLVDYNSVENSMYELLDIDRLILPSNVVKDVKIAIAQHQCCYVSTKMMMKKRLNLLDGTSEN